MSQFVEVKTAELVGMALDWAVAKAIGYQMIEVHPDVHGNNAGEVLAPAGLIESGYRWPNFGRVHAAAFCNNWSTNWAQGGPLIDEYEIEFKWVTDATIEAYSYTMSENKALGGTHLEAACRLIAMELGEVVQVPTELVGVK